MYVIKRLVAKNINSTLAPILSKGRKLSTHARIITSGLPDVEIPKISVSEYILENLSRWENHTATECAVTGRKYTYNEVRRKSKNLAGTLRKRLKLDKGDVIAVLLPNVPEYAIIHLATFRSGLICTPINPMYTPAEISRQLLDSSAKAIITLNELWTVANAATDLAKRNIPILTVNTERGQASPRGALNFFEFTESEVDSPDVSITPNDVAILPYSSGTTGLPKGVPLTHSNIVSNICQLEHPLINCNQISTATQQDVTPAVLPMFHIYGITVLSLFQLRLGCKIVTLPKFTPELYITTLRRQKPDVLYVAPPIAIFLASYPSVKKEDFDSVRTIVNGAAPLGVLDAEKLLKKAQRCIPLQQGYGLTETSPGVLLTRISDLSNKNIVGSLGNPIPNTEVKVIGVDDATGTPLGPNQVGELLIRGPQVMKGYFNRPDENANIFLDGWMRTGDMMYYNDDGFLFITDRLKELIKVKGYQVPPAELEEIIRAFPDVAEAAVIGIPHTTHGEVPRAYVVPHKGCKIDEIKLKEYVNSHVASYKQVRGGISIVSGIPKNAVGKILRKELKLLYEKEMNT